MVHVGNGWGGGGEGSDNLFLTIRSAYEGCILLKKRHCCASAFSQCTDSGLSKAKLNNLHFERTKSSLNLLEGFPCSSICWSDPDPFTDTKEKKIFLKYKEIQMGAVAKSYMRKGFLIYEEMRKYLVIYEEAVSHI
jgi:hypothetical protein